MGENKETEDNLVYTHQEEFVVKVIVIGDPSVGKTSLLNRFTSKQFKEQYIPTVGVNIVKENLELNVGKEQEQKVQISVLLWDIAGQPQFYMLHRPYNSFA